MPLKTTAGNHGEIAKGRGATINPEGRFEKWNREEADDGWFQDPLDEPAKPKTVIIIEHVKTIITRNDSPDIGFDRSINPYRGCAHGCPFCVGGDTLISMADGTLRAISEIRAGDEIFGTQQDGIHRRYSKSRVIAHWSKTKPAYRMTLADGTTLDASGDHRFLDTEGWKYVKEAATGLSRPRLVPGDVLMGVSGLIDEGDDDSGSTLVARRTMRTGQRVESDARLRVVSIEPLGKAMRLYDITTETEDFIANGVVSHNCYARPSHGYLGLSPGLDFETRLFVKPNAAEKLREELAKPGYRVEPIAIGVNTDAYQPIEREYKITRSILEVLEEAKHPTYLITKSALIERDIDILAELAKLNLVSITITIVTLDHEISRRLEPRTTAPARRLKAIERLAAAGIPVNVNIAPVIPFLTDSELEAIMEAAKNAGAHSVAYTLLRLPWEVRDIFKAWLEAHYPLKAEHVMSRVRDMRGGKENDPNFGSRMHGQGEFGELLRQRFRKGLARYSLDRLHRELDCSLFIPPSLAGQGNLF